MAAVQAAVASEDFAERFRFARQAAVAKGQTPTSLEAVRHIALQVLKRMAVETAGVILTFSWEPAEEREGGQLAVHVRPAPAEVLAQIEKLRARKVA